ncbi:MAG: DUF952 domain-containing protein [Hyphomicrobiaceae bacterium]
MAAKLVYKISPRAAWDAAVDAGTFTGAPVDVADGFIHFSTAEQVAETAAKHFRGQGDLVLIAIDAAALGADLKWEPSRGGALFPHLYAPLDVAHARHVVDLPLDAAGVPVIPVDLAVETGQGGLDTPC